MAKTRTEETKLELDEHLGFQQRQWRVQVASWWVIAALMALAVFGLFGSGPLSYASSAASSTGASLRLEYERFVHALDESELRFALQGFSGQAVVRLDQTFLEAIRLEGVEPEPDSVRVEEGWTAFTFEQHGVDAFIVKFFIRPEHAGRTSGFARLNDGPTVRFNQFIYP